MARENGGLIMRKTLTIKTVSGLQFTVFGECNKRDGIYYINGESYPEEIVIEEENENDL